jgi:hypothetical protein
LTWHSSEHVPRGSGLQCVERKNTPNWFTQKWVNMMKYDEICISNFIVFIKFIPPWPFVSMVFSCLQVAIFRGLRPTT